MQGTERLQLREVGPGSVDYYSLLSLRFNRLRKPLGMEWTPEELMADEEDRHFGLREEGEWLAVAVVHELGDGAVKLRQIAVTDSREGEGLGRHLMEMLGNRLAREGIRDFSLHARLVVAGFYEAMGFQREGEEFEEIGLPHIAMRRILRDGSA